MKITLKELHLINFKGIKKLSIKFDSEVTNIMGDNATGKTTIFDAFTWLFFGKESTDRKDFNIKNTVDKALNRQEHEVNAVLDIDGAIVPIRRIYKEKWVKKRGESTTEFSGHETEYFWDDVPANQSEFNAKVGELINESIFKLIANPSYFNSLNWKDRRNILFDIAGTVTNEEIAQGNVKFEGLVSQLTNNKTLDDLKKQFSAKKKLIKVELDAIPTRIDEINRNMPNAPDSAFITSKIGMLEEDVKKVETAMFDRSNANEAEYNKISNHQALIYQAQEKLDQRKFDGRQAIIKAQNTQTEERNEIANRIPTLRSALEQIEKQENRRIEDINRLKLDIVAKRKDWDAKRAEWDAEYNKELVFDEHKFSCPTCKRAYESGDVAGMKLEMGNNFQQNQARILEKISAELVAIQNLGKVYAEDLIRLEAINKDEEILSLKADIDAVQEQLNAFDLANKSIMTIDELLAKDEVYQGMVKKLSELKESLPEKKEVDVSDLRAEKVKIETEISSFKKLLANEDVIKDNKTRITELEEEEKTLANELAEYEGNEFLIDAFNKEMINAIESRINGKFEYVTFKMFNPLINGGEEETCETMVKGVPYSDLNNAARINAGLDIINTLCEHYKVNVPCFIDNAESITSLIEVQSQIIRLVVSEQDKQLRVA